MYDKAVTFGILQAEEEILWAIDRARNYFGKPINVVCELGSYQGGSLAMWSLLLDDNDYLLLSIDPETHGNRVLVEYIKEHTGKDALHIKGGSEDLCTVANLESILDGRKIDLLFIDSIHTAAQSEREIYLYQPFVNSPGIIGFHDIYPFNFINQTEYDGYYGDFQVSTGMYWNMMKYNYSYEEKKVRRADMPKNAYGIGLLFL